MRLSFFCPAWPAQFSQLRERFARVDAESSRGGTRLGAAASHVRRLPLAGNLGDVSIYDIAPTLLTAFGCPVPGDMIGRSLLSA
jgi:arylsulfatase A-like enzyme